MRKNLPLIVLVLSVVVGVASALAMRERVRIVDIVTLFAGGCGTGASIVATLRDRRRAAKRAAA